jgi:hypothetical protein
MAMAKKRQQGQALDPCENCGGQECGTARIPVCCADCTH